MLKLFFWFLLLANGALFAFHQGYLDTLLSDTREPPHIAIPLNADKIKLVNETNTTPPVASTPAPVVAPVAASVPAPEPAAVAPDKKPEIVACTEIGNFNAAEAKRFEEKLATL